MGGGCHLLLELHGVRHPGVRHPGVVVPRPLGLDARPIGSWSLVLISEPLGAFASVEFLQEVFCHLMELPPTNTAGYSRVWKKRGDRRVRGERREEREEARE